MRIDFFNMDTGDRHQVDVSGAVTVVKDHLWQVTDRRPDRVLVAWFREADDPDGITASGNQDGWELDDGSGRWFTDWSVTA